jgi:putative IMPACT (imprinted ancient) family translation regulator
MRIVKLSIDYTLLGKVENELRSSEYIIKEISYTDKVDIYCYVKETDVATYSEYVLDLTNGSGIVSFGEYEFLEKLIKN